MRKFGAILLLSLAVGLGALGCGGHSGILTITSSITPSGTVSLDAGQSIAFTATTDGDSTNSGVAWDSITPGTLTDVTTTSVTYVAPATLAGPYQAAVLATPIRNSQYSATVFINLYPALVITKPTLPTAKTLVPYSYQFASTGGLAPISWSITSGALPTGLTLSSSGLLSGTPTVAGPSSFTVSVTDSTSGPASVASPLTLTVTPSTLGIATTSIPYGQQNQAYSTTLASSAGTAPFTWTVSAGSLPAGLTLSSAGVLAGTPTVTGTFTFTAKVVDSGSPKQTATQSFTFTIYGSLVISTTTLPPGTTGLAYTTTLLSNGGHAPITWSLANGSSLPGGLSLSAAGVISGTPTSASTFSFTVQATDAISTTVSQALSLKVVLPSTLKIATTSLPTGNIGSSYSATLAATLGNPPYTWSIQGSLPTGLTFSPAGVLSGTLYVAGTTNITFAVTDSTSATVTASLPLTIGTTLSGGAGNALLSGSYAFLINGKLSGSSAGKVYGFGAIGSLIADGTGAITGVEDINTPTGVQSAVSMSGRYMLGTDGRGLLVLTAGSTTNVYTIAVSNRVSGVAQQIAISEFDNSDGTGAVASGFGLHQMKAAFAAPTLKGTFAFGLSGESPCTTCVASNRFGPLAVAGILTADGVSAISAGTEDAAAYALNYAGVSITGTFTAPSTTTGRGTMALNYTGTLFPAPPADYTYVIVNANEFLWLSNDSHATTALLLGDARLQQQATYSTSSFSGASISYESQSSGGDGNTVYPPALNAMLSAFTNTGAGTGTYQTDSNLAGTYTAGAAKSVTYTTAANGRTAIATGSSNHVLYLYDTGAGFAVDLATAAHYPALVRYELQVATGTTLEPLLSGSYAMGTVTAPVASTTSSGIANFSFYTGGVNTGISGKIFTTTDSSTVSGTLTIGQTSNAIYGEDTTGRFTLNDSTTSVTTGIAYGITNTRGVSLPTSSATMPVVTVLQQ